MKTTQSGISVAQFGIAVNRRVKQGEAQQADFFNVTAWRATGDFVSKFFKKGSSIFVVGTIQNRSWTDSEGNKRYATDIVADEVMSVDSRSESGTFGGDDSEGFGNSAPSFSTPAGNAPKFEEIKTDDDLPF